MEVQSVTSPGGIEAWLVEDFAEPMFTLSFALRGGSAHDPVGKEGMSNFLALMLTAGAGDLNADAFEQQIQELAMKVEFAPGNDEITCTIHALSETRDEVAQLLNLVLTRARFDDEHVERVRRRLLSYHGAEARTPSAVAKAQWNAVAFPGHPYAHHIAGTATSVQNITSEDLRGQYLRVFARDRLTVVAVGDISEHELGNFLDRLFAGLPATSELAEIPPIEPVTGGRLRVAEMELPQSTVFFGTQFIPFDSPDLVPAMVLNVILGRDALSSRLGSSLRQNSGLTFSTTTWLEPRRNGVVFRGSFASRNDSAGRALEILRTEMQKMADGDIGEDELDDAKAHISGFYLQVYVSHAEVAARLLRLAMAGFGPDVIQSRKAAFAAVTLDDLKRVARHLLDPDNLIVSIAGTPALQPRAGQKAAAGSGQ